MMNIIDGKAISEKVLEECRLDVEKLKEEGNRDPIVTENISDFTLTLEYIEIVLPEDLSQEEDTI